MVLLSDVVVPMVLQGALLSTIPILISNFANYMESWDMMWTNLEDTMCTTNCGPESYDFIIVGGGSAGAVMAARLSETSARVLLLEAGGYPNPWLRIPFFAPVINKPETDWGYSTVSLKDAAKGLPNNSQFWPRGKALGGSSNSNFMLYMRGNPNDFDLWASMTQDSRWNYENVENYFKKMEDYHGNWDAGAGHGQGGPLRVEGLRYRPGLGHFLDAAKEFGYDVKDPNVNQSQGFSPIDFTMKRGRRFGTYSAYIKPNRKRPNLIVQTYSHVTRIHFDGGMRATGVSYFRHGTEKTAEATKEIILSAGAVNSPQILMLSGIGPKTHLDEHGIKTLLDVPAVGQNLMDHVCTPYGPFLVNKPVSFMKERNFTLATIADYNKDGTGPLAAPLMVTGLGLVSTSNQPPSWPNLLFVINGQGLGVGLDKVLTEFLRTKPNLFPDYFKGFMGSDSYFIWQTLGLVKSKGEIRLRDGDPFSKPVIDPRFYTDEGGVDMSVMVEGMEIITNIIENSTALGTNLGAHLIPKELPGCEGLGRYSRAYKECYLRTLTLTVFHPSGTCAMGKAGAPGTVVDSELRVVGTKGLRVVDASVMPEITNANLNAPTIMIGEVAADLVKQTWDLN